jgi:hypothetical protein
MPVYAIVSERDLRAWTCEYAFAQAGRPFETGGERVSPSFVFWSRRTRSWSKTFSRVPLMDAGDCRILARISHGILRLLPGSYPAVSERRAKSDWCEVVVSQPSPRRHRQLRGSRNPLSVEGDRASSSRSALDDVPQEFATATSLTSPVLVAPPDNLVFAVTSGRIRRNVSSPRFTTKNSVEPIEYKGLHSERKRRGIPTMAQRLAAEDPHRSLWPTFCQIFRLFDRYDG